MAAENLPINIIPPAPVATASYDYVDLAEGAGFVTYYCYKQSISGSTTYGLTRDTNLYSVERETSGSATLDLDYDLPPFNLPQTIKGTAVFNGSHFIDGNQAGGPQGSFYNVFIRKWDGTTETEIASAVGPQLNVSAQNENNQILVIPITISSPVTFPIGSQLRLTVQHFLSGGLSSILYQGHDPKNRDGNKITAAANLFTAQNIKIPFRINLGV